MVPPVPAGPLSDYHSGTNTFSPPSHPPPLIHDLPLPPPPSPLPIFILSTGHPGPIAPPQSSIPIHTHPYPPPFPLTLSPPHYPTPPHPQFHNSPPPTPPPSPSLLFARPPPSPPPDPPPPPTPPGSARRRRPDTQPATQLQAVHSWHQDVKNDQVVIGTSSCSSAARPSGAKSTAYACSLSPFASTFAAAGSSSTTDLSSARRTGQCRERARLRLAAAFARDVHRIARAKRDRFALGLTKRGEIHTRGVWRMLPLRKSDAR